MARNLRSTTGSRETYLARVNAEPVLFEPDQADVVQSQLVEVATNEALARAEEHIRANADDGTDFWTELDDDMQWLRPYNVSEGVLYIPVAGALLNNFPWQLGGWATGYEYIEEAFKRGLEDDDVMGIVFDTNSGGGMVAGCFELCDVIQSRREEKPVMSLVAPYSYSAAYAISASTGDVAITESGGAGSIGVYTIHFDYSDFYAQRGIKPTIIQAGKFKTDGSHLKPLSESAQKRVQARIDKRYDRFVSVVSSGMGLDGEKVRATEALTYDAEEALEIGLVTSIGTVDEAVRAFSVKFNSDSTGGENQMSDISQEEHDKAVAEAKAQGAAEAAAKAEADVAKAKADGAKAEQERQKGIKNLDEAKTRPLAAASLAENSELTVDAAKAVLAGMAEETAPKAAAKTDDEAAGTKTSKTFQDAMNNDNPEVGADSEPENGGKAQKDSDLLLAAYSSI